MRTSPHVRIDCTATSYIALDPLNVMRRLNLPAVAVFTLYFVCLFFLVHLYLDTGNRYSWMKDLDPEMSALPFDAEAQMRVAIFIVGAALPTIAGLLVSRGINSRRLRIAARTIGALLLVAALLKGYLLV